MQTYTINVQATSAESQHVDVTTPAGDVIEFDFTEAAPLSWAAVEALRDLLGLDDDELSQDELILIASDDTERRFSFTML